MKNVKRLVLLVAGCLISLAVLITCGRSGPEGPPDLTPPVISTVDPADQSSGIAIDKSITVTFNEPVDPKTISFGLIDEVNHVIGVPVTMNYSGTTVVFTPNAMLLKNTAYNAVLNPGVKDLSGNTMLTQRSWYFTTGSTVSTGPTHTVTATAGPNGTIAPQGAVAVVTGTTKSFTVTPNAGYRIDQVTGCGGILSGQTYTTAPITADCAVTATFAAGTGGTHTITATAGAGGSIAPSGTIAVADGATQMFTVTSAQGFHITSVLGCSGTLSGNLFQTGPVTADCTVTASFALDAPITHTITANAGTGGSISPSGSVSVNDGTNQKFTITPTTGYHVSDVKVDGTSIGAVTTYTFNTVKADHTISATFAVDIVTFTITANAGTGGTIVPSGTITVTQGASRSFSVTANTGYLIASVTGCGGTLIGSTYTTGPINADCSISANFKKAHTIKTVAGINGAIIPAGDVIVPDGNSETFSIAPSTGYNIQAVVVDSSPPVVVSTYQFSNVTTDHTISATFAAVVPVTHVISAITTTGGAIAPAGTIAVNDGGSLQFTIAASPGSHIADVLVDGFSMGPVATYTFSNVTTDHSIFASFAPDPSATHVITSTASAGGQVAPLGAVIVPDGGTQTYAITPDPGFQVQDVIVDLISAGSRTSYEYTHVTGDHTIAVQFAAPVTAKAGTR